jgi:hypothetical protein
VQPFEAEAVRSTARAHLARAADVRRARRSTGDRATLVWRFCRARSDIASSRGGGRSSQRRRCGRNRRAPARSDTRPPVALRSTPTQAIPPRARQTAIHDRKSDPGQAGRGPHRHVDSPQTCRWHAGSQLP